MKYKIWNNLTVITVLTVLLPFICKAQNPIIQTNYTADPAPMVYNETVFLYTGHDEDDAFGFKMQNWMLYTSTDMVNWTDHGIVASLKDFKWVLYDNGAWAAQCINRNGKFYLYCPMPSGVGIGVLVSGSPYGPFTDPIGKALIKNGPQDIDPTILIDDDTQAYLYWGNPELWYVKLNEDMISYSGEIIKTPEEFITGVKARYGKFADDLIKAYPEGATTVPKTARDLSRDAAFGWQTWIWARLQVQTGKSKVFYYYFDQHPEYPANSPKAGYGSPYGQDVAYVFQHLNESDPQTTKTDLEISDAMSTYFMGRKRMHYRRWCMVYIPCKCCE